MLDYREYIYAVYQEQSFSKAALKLHIAQPWLSRTIKNEERKLKCLLFDRSTTPISLTEEGKYYISQIQKVIDIEKEMEAYFSALEETSAQAIHIGGSTFFCTYVFPSLFADFQAAHPEVTLTFAEGDTKTLINKLLCGELDIVLEVEWLEQPQLINVPWATEEIILAVPAKFKINRELKEYCYTFDELLKRNELGQHKPSVPLLSFSNEPFLLLNESNDIHNRSMSICKNAGFSPTVKLMLTQMMTTYYLVCEKQGVAFLRSTIPEYVTPTDSIVFYQLADPLATRNIYLTYPKKKLSSVQKALIEYVKDRRVISKM